MAILEGAVQGFEAGQRAAAEAARLGLEQQQVNIAKQRADREDRRQNLLDKSQVINEDIAAIGHQARDLLTPPVDPRQDPEGYNAWLNSDDYKQREAEAQELDNRAKERYQQRQSVHNEILGVHAAQTRDQVAQDEAAVTSGQTNLLDLPSGNVADLLAHKAGMDPSVFRKDEKTGVAPIQRVAQDIHDGLQTGDWSGKADSIAALVPALHTAVGHQMGNGTVTGVSVAKVHMDPNDKSKLVFTPAYKISRPGQPDQVMMGTSEMAAPVPISQLGQRATDLQQLANLADHPEIQAKIQDSFKQRTTNFHRLHDDLLSAGVDPRELLPAPYQGKTVSRGAREFFIDPKTGLPAIDPKTGQPMMLEGSQYQSTATQRQDLIDGLVAQGMSPEEAAQRASLALHPVQYRGGLVGPDSERAPLGTGRAGANGVAKWTQSDKSAYESSLKNAIAAHFGAQVGDIAPGEDIFARLPKDAAVSARSAYDKLRQQMRADMRRGKDVSVDDYLKDLGEKPAAPAKPGEKPAAPEQFDARGLSDAEAKKRYDALPAGATFIGPDGKPYVKPKSSRAGLEVKIPAGAR